MSQPNIELEEKQNCLDIWGTLLEQETINQSNISTAESPKALVDFYTVNSNCNQRKPPAFGQICIKQQTNQL